MSIFISLKSFPYLTLSFYLPCLIYPSTSPSFSSFYSLFSSTLFQPYIILAPLLYMAYFFLNSFLSHAISGFSAFHIPSSLHYICFSTSHSLFPPQLHSIVFCASLVSCFTLSHFSCPKFFLNLYLTHYLCFLLFISQYFTCLAKFCFSAFHTFFPLNFTPSFSTFHSLFSIDFSPTSSTWPIFLKPFLSHTIFVVPLSLPQLPILQHFPNPAPFHYLLGAIISLKLRHSTLIN